MMKEAERKANPNGAPVSVYLRAARFAVDLHATQLVEHAMTQELEVSGDSVELRVMLGKMYLYNGQYEKSRMLLEDKVMARVRQQSGEIETKVVGAAAQKSTIAMTVMGNTLFMELGWDRLKPERPVPPAKDIVQWFEKAMSPAAKPPNVSAQQLFRVGRVQMATRKFQEAAETFRRAIKFQPSATAYLGCPLSPIPPMHTFSTRRVRLVRGEGRGVST